MPPGKQMVVFWSGFRGREGQGVELLLLLCTFSFGFVLQHWHTTVPGSPSEREQGSVSFRRHESYEEINSKEDLCLGKCNLVISNSLL